MNVSTIEIEVKRVYKVSNGKAMKAFVDIAVNQAILIKGLKVIKGPSGLFVSMPQEKSQKDNKWYDSVRPLSQEVRDQIAAEVLKAYGNDELI